MRGWHSVAVCLLIASVVPAAGAEDIYKCVRSAGTTYQSTPCAAGSFETRLDPVTARDESSRVAPQAAPVRAPGRRPGPWKHRALALGMSDDEVLNMAGWGRPSRITRQRLGREWREEWIYGADTAAERRLTFSNGKLVDFGVRPADDRIAVSSLR